MKLKYRGVSYECTLSPAPQYGPPLATGNYRGAKLTLHTLAEAPPQPEVELTWRGIRYHAGTCAPAPIVAPASIVASDPVAQDEAVLTADLANATVAAAIPAASSLVIADQARSLLMRHHQRIRRREQAMLTRLDEEVGLSAADAARYESHIQGKTRHDFGGYDRSGAAMS